MKFLAIILIIGGLIWYFNDDESQYYDDYQSSGSSSYSSRNCLEPENPYGSGSGHYAGFEWAENKSPLYCTGNSNSFIEGCEEYLYQLENYENCADR